MNSNNLISVIIPMFNREETIQRAIQSVLIQKNIEGLPFDLEVIVVDDASKDASVKKVLELQDNRIKLILLKSNKGANYARNIGISNSKGKYIAFQDSDDEWCQGKLEKQITFLERKNYDLVSCGMKLLIKGKKGKYGFSFDNKNVNTSDLLKGNFISTQTIVAKREIFDLVTFDSELPRMQDWDFIFRVSLDYSIGFVNEKLVNQYIQEDSISLKPDKMVVAIEKIYEKFLSLYPMSDIELINFTYYLCSLKSGNKIQKRKYLKILYQVTRQKSILIRLLFPNFDGSSISHFLKKLRGKYSFE